MITGATGARNPTTRQYIPTGLDPKASSGVGRSVAIGSRGDSTGRSLWLTMRNSDGKRGAKPEDTVAFTALEVALATTPFAGGAAVLVNRMREARLNRFAGERLARIETTLAALQVQLGEQELARRLDTDEFIAAAYRTVAAMRQESDPVRLDQLRNALVNGYVLERSPRDRHRFLDLISRLGPDDITGLVALVAVEKNHEDVIRGADSIVADAIGTERGDLSSFVVLRHLAAEGLLGEHHDERVEALDSRIPQFGTTMPPPQGLRRIAQYTIPQFARDFLAQLSDPNVDLARPA